MSFRNDDNFDSESYVRVNTRLQQFHKENPTGRVETCYAFHEGVLVMRAALYRDVKDEHPAATGHAFLERLDGEKVGEYTETVAVGRALALMGYSIDKSLASGEEMSRFKDRQETKKEEKREAAPAHGRFNQKASPPQSQKAAEPLKKDEPKVEVKKEEPVESLAKAAPAEIKDTPTEVKRLTTSRIFKPLPKQEQQQTGGK